MLTKILKKPRVWNIAANMSNKQDNVYSRKNVVIQFETWTGEGITARHHKTTTD